MQVPGMPPGGKHPAGDVEVTVKKGSILAPSDLQAGRWTVSPYDAECKQYVTCHNLANGTATVFSINSEDVKVINPKKEQEPAESTSPESPKEPEQASPAEKVDIANI